ncbi:LOW QUALITY PROTEIN: Gag protein [Phytophthora palmivora]|uniref:Gag protein n=1 Tax=Phytophthora palmivora TaxID=4796 RepID=A0A2P4XK66_9STRA|nr:LOW QUALITY PROTEIN: Gag protein [Phytophthora palmivora]
MVTVFMDGLKVGPSRTQLFRVHANTIDEAIQIALQEEYSHKQACTPTHNASTGAGRELQQPEPAPGRYPWNWVRPYRALSAATDVGSSGTCNLPALREGKGSSLPNLGARGARGRSRDSRARGLGSPTVARNCNKFIDALCKSDDRGQVSVRLADGTVVNVPGVQMDLAVKFEDFESTKSYTLTSAT